MELPKADSLGLLEDSRLQPLRDWVALLQQCGDPERMGEIRELPVRDALGRVHDISQDDYHRQMVEACAILILTTAHPLTTAVTPTYPATQPNPPDAARCCASTGTSDAPKIPPML